LSLGVWRVAVLLLVVEVVLGLGLVLLRSLRILRCVSAVAGVGGGRGHVVMCTVWHRVRVGVVWYFHGAG
jgi:hypothetical protein